MKRRTKILLFLILSLMGGFFSGEKCWAQEGNVVINEILIDGVTGEEFVELYNTGASDISLDNWYWTYYSSGRNWDDPYRKKPFPIGTKIKSHNFYTIIIKTGDFPTIESQWNIGYSTYQFSNSSGSIAIFPNNIFTKENCIDFISWGTVDFVGADSEFTPSVKKSWERTLPEKNTWQESYLLGGTPGYENFTGIDKEPPPSPPTIYSDKIIINEVLPKPDPENALYKEEFVELYNSGDEPENLDDWYLKDRAGKICSLSGKTLDSGGFLVMVNDSENNCALALNDTRGETLELYNPLNIEVFRVAYEGSAKKGRSYNLNKTVWHWSQFLTPGKENIFNNEPYGTVKIDKDIFINVSADFFISTGDADGEKVTVSWEFGDNHGSSLVKTRHKYTQEGIYTGSVKLSDGSADVLKIFTVEVKKYPEPKIKIVKINANPKGKDAEGEEIYLKNNSKKKINLQTWSLATGSKTLYNHPITKDFIIKPGKTKKITRKYSLFTLNNKKGVIELRYPNGAVASRVKYDKKKESVKDDEVYEMVGKKWQWNAPTEESEELEEEATLSENPENINSETEPEISKEEISLNLGKRSAENKLVLAEIGFLPNNKNLLQSRETAGIVLGAFSTRREIHRPVEIKPANSWQKTLQKSNQLLNFLINRIIGSI